MVVNAHPDYIAAEKEYFKAVSIEEKIEKLKKMISFAPGHKGGENLRAHLKIRLKKLLDEKERIKKIGKSSKVGIKKEDLQAVIIGKTNSGKSSLLNQLTNAKVETSQNHFLTTSPKIGTMHYQGANVQIIENPAINSEYYDKGITNTADTLIIIINSIKDLEEIDRIITGIVKNKIIVLNKSDTLNQEEKRKISSTLQSKKYNFVLFSSLTKEGKETLKEKIFSSFNKIRVYTKEPGREKSKNPIIFDPGATTRDVAEKIFTGFSEKIKETKIWGPSSKFPGQVVGLNHKLKDLDIVEFKTR